MKIAIVGTGAMGSVYAGLLGKAGTRGVGHRHLAGAHRRHRQGRAGGLRRQRHLRRARPARRAHAGDAGPCDVWVIATKASDVEEVAPQSPRCCGPTSVVMAFQNGLGAGERVARHVPRRTC